VILETEEHTNAAGIANSAARPLPLGTVCISRTASLGYVVILGAEMATSQDFVNWIPTGAVTSGWLRIVFLAGEEALGRFSKGSVHRTVYFPEWLSMHIAVPPVAEQDRIEQEVARQLSALDAQEETLSAAAARVARLRQSILTSAFEGKLLAQERGTEVPSRATLETPAVEPGSNLGTSGTGSGVREDR